ncbi:hypothetical protein [Streptococcus plurextorum]|uniref:hypothetical protein n=1 Tax=Streptococcus plurextorum TaxID=456876 RepID=UPI0004878E2B|nr:hypothetical protein [Streptococcus plurextorum]
MKKRRIFISLVVAITILILGGCGMTSQKETLTKEQQDNVVRWIARGYEVNSVEFTNFERDKKTGMYLLSFKLNNNSAYETTFSVRQLKEFDESSGILGLNPINRFKNLEREEDIEESQEIKISKIKITYVKG